MKKNYVENMIDQIKKSSLSRREICERANVSKSWLDKVMSGSKKNIMSDKLQSIINILNE